MSTRRQGGRGRRTSERSRRLAPVIAAIAIVVTGVGFSAGTASAAVTSFAMSPTSGAPGTLVHVSGEGCTPELLASAGANVVTVTATTLNLVFQAPVAANGSWRGSFVVPVSALAGLNGLPAPVDAVCTSGGLQSLSTIYTPQTFTVRAATAAPPSGGTTGGGSTSSPGRTPSPTNTSTPPTTRRGPQSTTPPSSAPASPPGSVPVGIPGGFAGGAGGVSGGDTGSAGSLNGNRTVAALANKHAAANRSASLPPTDLGASLASDAGKGSGGLGWLGWLLLLALVVAALGALALLWHSRQGVGSEPVGESP